MKTIFPILVILTIISNNVFSQYSKKSLHNSIDKWHNAAAIADANKFFGFMDSSSVYIGTDVSERWIKDEFIKFAKPYFDRGKAWEFKAYDRHITFSNDGKIAWFDELLETWMGNCRGSGVVIKNNENWKLLHYHLSITVPNEKIYEFIDLINPPKEEINK